MVQLLQKVSKDIFNALFSSFVVRVWLVFVFRD